MTVPNLDWILEPVLLGLLLITLVHAVRLERALRHLRQDRVALGHAIAGFDSSTKLAEAGFSRLQVAATEASSTIGQKLDQAVPLKDDLQFLIARGEVVADRLDALVRASRTSTPSAAAAEPAAKKPAPLRSQAERDLLLALRGGQ